MSNIKNISQKAAELKAAMQQVPPKVAEIREAVAATTGQLRHLKSEIQHSVADLKADDEDRLSAALQEINNSDGILAQAGFVLSGVDLEISPVQRLLVHLSKVEEIHTSTLRALISANKQHRTMHAILSSLLQANQMAETVEFDHLGYCELTIVVGPIPSVRLCWRPAEVFEAAQDVPAKATIPLLTPASAVTPTAHAMFGPGSFFEKRSGSDHPALTTAQVSPSTVPGVDTPAAVAPRTDEPKTIAPAPPAASPTGKEDPLARFKKMPTLSKPRQ